jgi:hypothetical protein
MTYALSKFVSIPSVSACPSHAEDCRQAAIWLRKCLGQLGARTTLVSHELFLHFLFLFNPSTACFSCQQEKERTLLSWGLLAGPKVVVRNLGCSSMGKFYICLFCSSFSLFSLCSAITMSSPPQLTGGTLTHSRLQDAMDTCTAVG